MLKSSVEFQNQSDLIAVFYEDDQPPFSDRFAGSIKKDSEGYYRFHPARRAILTVKLMMIIITKMSDLNTGGGLGK